MRWLDDITDSKDMNLVKLWEMMKGQESLVCSSPWGPKELDMTWQLNNKNKEHMYVFSTIISRSLH